jgi:flagellar biosynthesis protein FlhB
MSGEKSEQPTAQRKREARRDGRIARTPDLASWAGMLVASMLLPLTVRNLMATGQRLLVRATGLITAPDPGKALRLFVDGLGDAALTAAPLVLGMLVLGVAAGAVQGGLRPAMKLIRPQLSRLNPLSGVKRAFGPHALWEATKILVKSAVLGGVLSTVGAIETFIRSVALAGLVMAGADYAMARRRIGKQIKMTKQEVKDEHKRSEGDPLLRSAIRSRQMAMSRNRMMSDLPKADVVLVNPTHVAVALRYDPARGAPRVVAKGAGTIAAKIRDVATEKRIPMVHDVALARTLYTSCELGAEIPPQLYGAVARVLAFIMTLKARGSAAGLHRNVLAGVA